MAFSDPRYVFILAAIAFLTSLLPAGRSRLLFLVAVSFVFALGLGATATVLPLVGLAAFVGGLFISRMSEGRAKTAVFVSFLVLSLSPLLFYKYWGLAPGINSEALLLPVGISFYSFMAAGYLIDTFIDRGSVQTDPLKFAAFLSFFPHLTAGPIARASSFFDQLPRLGVFDGAMIVSGLRSILVGLCMKVAIADTLAPHVDRVYSDPSTFGAIDHVLATIYFSFQVYADFAGYSLIAIGSARLLGIELMQNFDNPYLSQSLPEYWRRWHISLSSWFRDYVFVPLQFRYRRAGKRGLAGALVVTFTLVGIWHGAGPQYAIFGLIHGVLVSISTLTIAGRTRFWRARGLPVSVLKVVRTLNTFLIITATFVLFRAQTIPDAMHMYQSIGTFDLGQRTVALWPLAACALLVAGDFVTARGFVLSAIPRLLRWPAYHAATFVMIVFMLLHAQQGSPYANQFIYFKF